MGPTPPTKPAGEKSFTQWVKIAALVGAIACLLHFVIAILPADRFTILGSLLRKASDVTPDRVARLRGALLIIGGVWLALSIWLWRNAESLFGTLAKLRREIQSLPASIYRQWKSLSRRDQATLLLLLAAAIAVRLKFLHQPMAYDEAYSFTNFASRPLWEALADYNNTNNHLLNSFFMHVEYRLLGQQDWALRLHVLAAGFAIVAIAFPWACLRAGTGPALLVTAMMSVSPLLVDYSVNARGYSLLLFFALAFDLILLLVITRSLQDHILPWLGLGICWCLGFWSLPIMLYPAVASAGWFYWWSKTRPGLAGRFTVTIAVASLVAGLGYIPAFVFRGLLATENKFVHANPFADWLVEFPAAWWNGLLRFSTGPMPVALWSLLFVIGIIGWGWSATKDQRSAPWKFHAVVWSFFSLAILMSLHRVAPPPRLFFTLAPWFYLVTAIGPAMIVGGIQRFASQLPGDLVMRYLAYAWMAWCGIYLIESPILREPQQREWGIGSVPPVIDDLAKRQADSSSKTRLLVPLPCDHPAIYYAHQKKLNLEVNGKPALAGEIWLVTKVGQTPADTLKNVVVRWDESAWMTAHWQHERGFAELILWRAKILPQLPTGNP